MSEVKLTFIVPVYNKQSILERCIKSFLDQSLKNWEAVFVLDGPDEAAKSTIHRMMKKAPNGYKVVEIEHGGACKARNEGAKHAKGQYWVFFDADCLIEPDTAKAWVDILDREPETAFVYSGYKFLNEQGALNSEPFDPWLLKVRNYISSCFPLRREFFPGWNESLKSLQDWNFWLDVVAKGGKGKYLLGYGFSTEYPTVDSISGKGCTPEAWLERVDAVKKLHNLPERATCVTSVSNKGEAIRLAKLIDADYQDYPNYKPHRYKNIVQVGFNPMPEFVQRCSENFGNPQTKNFLFWTGDDITVIYNCINFRAILNYSILLNGCAIQFVEDKTAKDLMEKAGFKVKVLPIPIDAEKQTIPLPEKPRFLVDVCSTFGKAFQVIDGSLPDVKLDVFKDGQKNIDDYTGLICFYDDKTMQNGIKQALLRGRHVISNVRSPHTGFLDDNVIPEVFVKTVVERVRQVMHLPFNEKGESFYRSTLVKDNLLEALNEKPANLICNS